MSDPIGEALCYVRGRLDHWKNHRVDSEARTWSIQELRRVESKLEKIKNVLVATGEGGGKC